jgi:hypothetical protein
MANAIVGRPLSINSNRYLPGTTANCLLRGSSFAALVFDVVQDRKGGILMSDVDSVQNLVIMVAGEIQTDINSNRYLPGTTANCLLRGSSFALRSFCFHNLYRLL